MARNAADVAQVKEASRVEKDRSRRATLALKSTLATPFGRELLWLFLRDCGLYTQVFHRDAGVMAFQAGRQHWGQQLLAQIIEVDSDAYLTMEREARDREARDQAAIDAASSPRADTEEPRNA